MTKYELGYDMRDIEEREEFEDYLCDLADIYEEACHKRGIELWKDEQK